MNTSLTIIPMWVDYDKFSDEELIEAILYIMMLKAIEYESINN